VNKVLVISNKEDDHIQLVSNMSDLEFVLFDPMQFIYDSEILSFYTNSKGQVQGMYNNHNLNEFKVFWYRKPKFFSEQEYPVEEDYREHCRENYIRLIDTLFNVYRQKFWVNHPYDIKYADNKMTQLTVARSLGFNISDTLISNSTQESIRFINGKQTVVAKTLGQRRVKSGDLYSNGPLSEIGDSARIKKDLQANELGLNVNPHIFQVYSAGSVHRVIMVNGNVFSIKTIALKPDLLIDSRAIMLSEEYSVNIKSQIPEYLKEKCLNYLDYFNLKYGAFDFIESTDGNFLFLECNPNGQWGFVDLLTNENNIAKEFAKFFQSV
jgi:hypothetical protein